MTSLVDGYAVSVGMYARCGFGVNERVEHKDDGEEESKC